MAVPIYAAVCDVNGLWRGKRVSSKTLEDVKSKDFKMPLSILFADIWGRDIDGSPLFQQSGDQDASLEPTGREAITLDHRGEQAAPLLPYWFCDEDGKPSPLDPRGALYYAAQRFKARGLTPIIGTELEFYIFSKGDEWRSGAPPHTLLIDEIREAEPFFEALDRQCLANGIAADVSTSEGGPGQYELVISHSDDALKAADDFMVLKYIIRSLAPEFGFSASFMAKPLAEETGNGFHAHVSLVDGEGRNVFASDVPQDNVALCGSLAGLLAAMPQSMLLFAPHLNSYRRFTGGQNAPFFANWGLENRTAAIRVPESTPNARRIEHRLGGADVNVYLALTAILRAMEWGLDAQISPPVPVVGNDPGKDAQRLPSTWVEALALFNEAKRIGPLFPDDLHRAIVDCKRQEVDVFSKDISPFERETYGWLV